MTLSTGVLGGLAPPEHVLVPLGPSFALMKLVRTISVSHETYFNRILEKVGITRSQLEILMVLLANPEKRIKQRALEQALNLSNPTVTGLLKRLEGKCLVRREPDPDDARAKSVLITERAKHIADRLDEMVGDFDRQFMQDFSDEELELLQTLLTRFHQGMCRRCEEYLSYEQIFISEGNAEHE